MILPTYNQGVKKNEKQAGFDSYYVHSVYNVHDGNYVYLETLRYDKIR